MLSKHSTIAKRTITFLVIGLVFAISTAFAIANCGPGFHNKKEAVSFFKSNPAAAAALAKEVSKHKAYNFHADQDIIAWLEQPNVKAFKAPMGYRLTHNTYCPSGPGDYQDYAGLLDNMGGKVMLWYGNKAGKYFPILKGYCRNAVFGPPVVKKPPRKKKPPCKCRPPKKPKCHKHKCKPRLKPPTICKQGEVMIGNGCSPQTNNAQQECEAKVDHTWDSNTMVCVQVQQNGVCSAQSGVVNGDNNTVDQDVKCCIGTNSCSEVVVTPPPEEPCGCTPEEPKKPKPQIELETINDFETNEFSVICSRSTTPSGDNVSVTYFAKGGGSFGNHGVGQLKSGTTNEWCAPYTASSEPGYSTIKVVLVDNTTGLSCEDEQQVYTKQETF